MKYTTLPTKPGQYTDRIGDDWELTEDQEWYYYINSRPSPRPAVEKWLPFTDAPKDDAPTSSDDKMQRIENIKDIKVGDRVYFCNDLNGYKLTSLEHKNYLCVSLCETDSPSWLRDVLSCADMLVNRSFFDHAERPKPSWPNPTDNDMHVYQGADGKKYLYLPFYEGDNTSWRRLPYYRNNGCYDAKDMAMCYPAALPLKELKIVQEEEES